MFANPRLVSPVNKTPKDIETRVFNGIEEHLKEDPVDSTKRVFSFLGANGIKPLWRLLFQDLPLTTFRALVVRYKEANNLTLLRKQETDHCICRVCETLSNDIAMAESNLRVADALDVNFLFLLLSWLSSVTHLFLPSFLCFLSFFFF